MSNQSNTIPEIHELLGKVMPYAEGLRRVHELEARYGVRIMYSEHTSLTEGPDEKKLIISDYENR